MLQGRQPSGRYATADGQPGASPNSPGCAHGSRSGHLLERMTNPASGIEKFREQVRKRFLSETELLRLGEASREAETTGIPRMTSKSKHGRKPENRVTNIGPHGAATLRAPVA